jgi:hypothetical protein
MLVKHAEFGLIPKEHWNQPEWIDEHRASKSRKEMAAKGSRVRYAGLRHLITCHGARH